MNEAAWHHNLNRGVLIAPAVTYDGRNGNGVWKGSQLRTRLRLDVTDISEVICEIGEELLRHVQVCPIFDDFTCASSGSQPSCECHGDSHGYSAFLRPDHNILTHCLFLQAIQFLQDKIVSSREQVAPVVVRFIEDMVSGGMLSVECVALQRVGFSSELDGFLHALL